MPYSSSKKNDVFISYAHDDNIDGWVKHFAKLSERTLNKQLKILEYGNTPDVKVWKDSSLPASGSLQARLEDAIKNSALFLVIMSESYLVSKWCKREGEEFVHNLRDNIQSRIFIAEKEKTDRNNWPEYLKDNSGSPLLSKVFHEETDVGEYKPIPVKDRTGDFNAESADLMTDFCRPISDILYSQKRYSFVCSDGTSRRVFLALCPETEGETWNYLKRLRDRLGQMRNIEVLPEIVPTDFENSLSERLDNCDLFVQILDGKKGAYLSARETGFVGHQFEEAQERNIRILQWKVPGLDRVPSRGDPYHRFLADLKADTEPGGTLVNGESLDPLIAKIEEALTVDQCPPIVEEMETIRIEIRSLWEDRKEAHKIGKAINERARAWNQRAEGEKICIDPIAIYRGAQAEEIDLLSKLSKGTVIVYAKDFNYVHQHGNIVRSDADRIGRIAICDPVPKDAEVLALRHIEMFSTASAAEREQEIDGFIEELVNTLASNR